MKRRILKMTKRHLKKFEIGQWYYKELDAVLDILFNKAAEQGIASWVELARETKGVDGIGLTCETIVRLGERITKRPQFRTVLILAAAVGQRISIVPREHRISLRSA